MKSPADLDYELPPDRIALQPAAKREEAKLLVLHRENVALEHAGISDLPRYLRPGDLLVTNRARVDPARILFTKPGGGAAELLLLRLLESGDRDSVWEAILGGKGLDSGRSCRLPGGVSMLVEERRDELGRVRLSATEGEVGTWMGRFGIPPLPPYIRRNRARRGLPPDVAEDRERYQTVFASQPGAVAAPTAGLHFTPDLFERLSRSGVERTEVFLAVGWGTFQPLAEEQWKSGKLHPEWVEVPADASGRLLRARRDGRRIVAVGTTVVRSLEWWARSGSPPEGLTGWCDLFLRTPWKPGIPGAMLTNFHLPRSSLLALVAAFCDPGGAEKVLGAYREAVREGYRFYSYGDAMLMV